MIVAIYIVGALALVGIVAGIWFLVWDGIRQRHSVVEIEGLFRRKSYVYGNQYGMTDDAYHPGQTTILFCDGRSRTIVGKLRVPYPPNTPIALMRWGRKYFVVKRLKD